MVLASFGGNSINYGDMHPSNLSVGANFDPKDIRNKVNSWVKKNATLPSSVKPQDLLNAAKEKGGSDIAVYAAQRFSSLKQATAANVVALEGIANSYSQSMMKLDQGIQAGRAGLGQAQMRYGIETGIQSAEYGGARAAAQNYWEF